MKSKHKIKIFCIFTILLFTTLLAHRTQLNLNNNAYQNPFFFPLGATAVTFDSLLIPASDAIQQRINLTVTRLSDSTHGNLYSIYLSQSEAYTSEPFTTMPPYRLHLGLFLVTPTEIFRKQAPWTAEQNFSSSLEDFTNTATQRLEQSDIDFFCRLDHCFQPGWNRRYPAI